MKPKRDWAPQVNHLLKRHNWDLSPGLCPACLPPAPDQSHLSVSDYLKELSLKAKAGVYALALEAADRRARWWY